MKTKILYLISLFTIASFQVFGKIHSVENRIGSGTNISANVNSSVTVDFTGVLPNGVNDVLVENYVFLGVNYNHLNQSTGVYSVVVLVNKYGANGSLQSSQSITLIIDNSSSITINDEQIVAFEGAYKTTSTIQSITVNGVAQTTLPDHIFLGAKLVVDRLVDFSTLASTPIANNTITTTKIDYDNDAIKDHLRISWDEYYGAEYYDVEWIYKDDYSNILNIPLPPGNLIMSFADKNASRISTDLHSYDVPLIFERGYILIRIRPVGRLASSPSVPVFGTWSIADSEVINVGASLNTHPLVSFEGLDQNITWQNNATFAENGKRKDVIAYYDGGNKNRQTVTMLSSLKIAVVGETIYDYTGRPALQVLPSPTVVYSSPQGNEVSTVHFYKDFNVVLNNSQALEAISAKHFDPDGEPCFVNAPQLSSAKGASLYYSVGNPFDDRELDFIPDAQEYPYSQTEYTPDNTGRIRRQGGVGAYHQLNSEHETFYYYGTPHQIQLDRLFGSEAGNASHYKKNLVVDPNGTVSVSYLDMADKVIATALIGAAPENLTSLEQEINYLDQDGTIAEFQNNHAIIESDLFNEDALGYSSTNTINIQGNSVIFNSSLLVPEEEIYSFNYDFLIEPFQPDCFQDICLHCIYDFELKIIDECGELIYSSINDVGSLVGHFSQSGSNVTFAMDCNVEDPYELDLSNVQLQLPRGEYMLSKVLTVNQQAVDAYVEQVLAIQEEGDCILTLQDFIDIYESQVNFDDCAIDFNCSECFEELGDRALFVATQPYSFEVNQLLYDWKYEACREKCALGSYCETGFQAMLFDMIPEGQYGATNPGPGYELSVYNDDNSLPKNLMSSDANWRNPFIILNGFEYGIYIDDYGNEAKVQLALSASNTYTPAVVSTSQIYFEGGIPYTSPQNLLNLEDFVDAFETSWAKSLVYYHPEYCFYESCKSYGVFQSPVDYLTSDQFDALLNSANTFDEALNTGLIIYNNGIYSVSNWFEELPVGEIPFSSDPSDINGADHPYDPFVIRGNQYGEFYAGDGPNFLGATLEDSFWNFTEPIGSNPSLSMLELAVYLNYCPVVPNAPECTSPFTDISDLFGVSFGSPANYTQQKDAMWINLRAFYLSKKSALQHQRDTKYVIEICPGYNGCIGNQNFNLLENDFYESQNNPIYEFQPCNEEYADLYLNKEKRFPTPNDIVVSIPSGSSFSEQCAEEYNLQNFLNFINNNYSLLSTDLQIGILPEFSAIYGQTSSFSSPMSMFTEWDAYVLPNGDLMVLWNALSMPLCTLSLSKPALLNSWDDVFYFSQLNGALNSNTFTVEVHFYENGNTYRSEIVDGTISCVSFPQCNTNSEVVCYGTQMKDDFQALCNALIADGLFYNPSFSLYPAYSDYLTPAIQQFFGNNIDIQLLKWRFINNPQENIKFGVYYNMNSPFMFIGGYHPDSGGPNASDNADFLSGIDEILYIDCSSVSEIEAYIDVHYLKDGEVKVFLSVDQGEKPNFCNCIPEPAICCQGTGYNEWERLQLLTPNLLKSIFIVDSQPIGTSLYTLSQFNQFFEPYTNGVNLSTPTFSHVNGTEVLTYDIGDCDLTFTITNDPNSTTWSFPSIVDIEDFALQGTPNLDGYFYSFTMKGLVQGADDLLITGSWCVPLRACEDAPPCGEILPIPEIIIEQADPCVQTLENVIYQNANNAYQQWLEDFTSTLAADYISHCISNVNENLRVSFMETEYHYTLYYYDQAGNLIRTVPPAGVKRLDIFSSNEPVAQRINEDRTFGTRRIFTFHNLQTTYVYNSLNQLVSQSIPDHDKMTVWDTSLPLGLPNDFVNQEFNFPSASFGFAAGTVSNRGYLYKSGDAGESWTKVDGLVAADIKKVKMLSVSHGFAIAEKGIILRTIDGGGSWDMLNTYSAFGTQTPSDWSDFTYSTNNLPITNFTGIKMLVVSKNGFMAMLTNLNAVNPTFTLIAPASITYNNVNPNSSMFTPTDMSLWEYSSVSFDSNGNFIVSADFVGPEDIEYSMLFRTPSSSTNTIQLTRVNISDINLQTMSVFVEASITKAFVGGDDGRLYYCPNLYSTSPEYFMIPTNHALTFDKIYFYNSKVGVAIMRSGVNRPLYRTVDGGRNWTLLSSATAKFNSLKPFSVNPFCNGTLYFNGARVLACGESGLVSSITLVSQNGNNSVGYSVVNTPNAAANFNDLWATPLADCANGNQPIRIVVVGDGGKIYTSLYYLTNSQWIWQDISKPSIPNDLIKMELTQILNQGDIYPVISGVMLDNLGALFSFFFDGTNPDCENDACDATVNPNNSIYCPNSCGDEYQLIPLTGNNIDGNVFTHIIKEEFATSIPKIWALTESNGTPELKLLTPLASSPISSASALSTTWTSGSSIGTINSIVFSNNSSGSDWVYCLTNGNEFRKMTLSSSGSTYNSDQSARIRPVRLIASDYGVSSASDASNKRMVAVGKNGCLLFSGLGVSNSQWYVSNTNSRFDLNCVSAANFNNGIIGTQAGSIVKYQITDVANQAWPNINYSTVVLTSSDPVIEVKCSAIGSNNTAMYAITDSGKLHSAANFNSFGMNHVANSNGVFRSIAYKLSTQSNPHSNSIIIAGKKSRFFDFLNGVLVANNKIFTPPLIDVNFRNAMEGYVVANNFTIRHTTDGGNSWSVVLSTFPVAANLSNSMNGFNGAKVLCDGENSAILVGVNANKPIIYHIENNIINGIVNSTSLQGFATNNNYTLSNIKRTSDGTLYIVGGKAMGSGQERPMILKKSAGASSWLEYLDNSNPNKSIRSLHIFPSNGALIVCGTAGYVNIWHDNLFGVSNNYTPQLQCFSDHASLNGVSTSLAFVNFEDVYFHDDLSGYLVGNSGIVFKTDLSASPTLDYEYITSGLLMPASGYQWKPLKSNDGLIGQNVGANYTIRTITFPTRWIGFYGGSYSVPVGLNRRVVDESGIFSTHFYYDRLGRIVLSQNTKQFNHANQKKYSYTIYDNLGRISEVGEKIDNSNIAQVQFKEIFGCSINGYFNSRCIDDGQLSNFISGNSGQRSEVTRTYYSSSPLNAGITQENLRNRVASVAYHNISTATFQHATHYSYDIHGNVKTLIQDFPEMDNPVNGNSKKRIDYRYDLISGNVLQVSYQSGKADQYYHRYEYDADNRITAVYTSDYGWEGGTADANLLMPEDMMFWERDAVYRYYKHGPLAKVEYGDLGVQGVDYAYTLQGWLKGVNSTKLDEVNDMGKDGNMAMDTPYQFFARDAFSYNLSYNKNDYSPIRGAQVGDVNCWLADNSNSFTQSNRFDLWNGNIGAMATTLNTGGANSTNLYQNMAYQYDQLNRLKSAVGQGNFDEQNNNWGANADITNRYKNAFTYDPNGNILTQKRYDQNGVQFDDLIYRYNYNNEGRFIDNRLYHVSDNIAANANAEDIDNQTTTAVFEPRLRDIHGSALNYAYDELGQLIRDNQESIEQIKWRVDGKISDIYRVNASGKKELSFVYDAMGNRVAKSVMTASGAWIETEYYVRDAQGNVMAIYKRSIRNDAMEFELTEQHIYGSTRLGVDRRNVDMIAAATPNDNGTWQVKRGEKHYELSNHLGNVLATVSDKKIAVMNGANLSYYRADVVSYSDYYPFGAPMTERTASLSDVRYGFNGQEKVDEVNGDGNHNTAMFWEYNTRLSVRWNVDPKPNPSISNYSVFESSPIWKVDVLGDTIHLYECKDYSASGNPIYSKGSVSKKLNEVLIDVMKTKEGREYFQKFAVKGQTIGGYTFKENGEFSDHELTIQEFSLSQFDWVNRAVPISNQGYYNSRISRDGKNVEAFIQIMTWEENKYQLGETLAHEAFLHGIPALSEFKAFDRGGRKEYERNQANLSGSKDHRALKEKDKAHVGYNYYNLFMQSLGRLDTKYLQHLNRVHKH